MRNIIASFIMGLSTGVITSCFGFEICDWQYWATFILVIASYWMGRYVEAKNIE